MDQQGLNFVQTAYGYLQYNTYQNPELYHESVAHFSKAMGNTLFIPPTPPPTTSTSNTTSNTTNLTTNHQCHEHQQPITDEHSHQHQHSHQHSHSSSCGHHHEDEITSIEALYPNFDPNSTTFSIPYEKPNSNHVVKSPQSSSSSSLQSSSLQTTTTSPLTSLPPLPKPNIPTQTIPLSNDDHDLTTPYNNDILYVGQDKSILHFKFILTGDQNAGKSTFLHALTNSYDNSFLLLNRYLPILQASFYNARLLPPVQTSSILSTTTQQQDEQKDVQRQQDQQPQQRHFIDEYPFIDTDIGITQLFLTLDDLLLCFDDLQPQTKNKKRKKNIPCIHSFNCYEELLQLGHSYPHVCLELIEIGGDHLDRLAQYILHDLQSHSSLINSSQLPSQSLTTTSLTTISTYIELLSSICQIYDTIQKADLITTTHNTNITTQSSSVNTNDIIPNQDLNIIDKNKIQLDSTHITQNGITTLLQRTLQLINYQPTQQPQQQQQQFSTTTTTIPQSTHDIDDSAMSDIENDSNHSQQHQEQHINQEQDILSSTKMNQIPLSYFLNLTTLCQYNYSNPITPIVTIDPQQCIIILLRMFLLILIHHHTLFERSFQQIENNNHITKLLTTTQMNDQNDNNEVDNNDNTIYITTHLLRAPFSTYNPTNSTLLSSPSVQFPSPFNNLIRQQQKQQQQQEKQQQEQLESTQNILPDLIFNQGEMELPIDPTIMIDPTITLQSLYNYVTQVNHQQKDQSTITQLHTTPLFTLFANVIQQYQQSQTESMGDNITNSNIYPFDQFLEEFINYFFETFFQQLIQLKLSQLVTSSQSPLSTSQSLSIFPTIYINIKYSTHTFPKTSQFLSSSSSNPNTSQMFDNTTTISQIHSDPGNLLYTIFSNINDYLNP